jgi:hypothetical protein
MLEAAEAGVAARPRTARAARSNGGIVRAAREVVRIMLRSCVDVDPVAGGLQKLSARMPSSVC